MPRLIIDLAKIEENTSLLADILRPHGVRLTGVTKACLGNELIAQAMLRGGAAALADSRLENISNLRRMLPDSELVLLRPSCRRRLDVRPSLCFVSASDQARAIIESNPVFPDSDPDAAWRFCLMIESGDGREGVPAELAADEAEKIFQMPGAVLAGLATNAACARPSASLDVSLRNFYEASSRILWRLGKQGLKARKQLGAKREILPYGRMRPFPVMSLGGSGFLRLLMEDGLTGNGPGAGRQRSLGPVTELRSGEAILLGRIPAGGKSDLYVPGAHRDAFVLEGEVLEVYAKSGETQALLDFGLQDVGAAPLIPCRTGVTPGVATSDYYPVSFSAARLPIDAPGSPGPRDGKKDSRAPDRPEDGIAQPGGRLSFIPTYYALAAAMTSPFVEKIFKGD